jgi:hypothetical protein
MHQIEVVGWDVPMPEVTCWAEWKPGCACPNRAAWLVHNLDNEGYTRLCGLHRDAFAAAEPEARVTYSALYTPVPVRQRHDEQTCAHCGCVPESHHSDGRCTTPQELVARLRFHQRTGRWPGPDEGGSPQEPGAEQGGDL